MARVALASAAAHPASARRTDANNLPALPHPPRVTAPQQGLRPQDGRLPVSLLLPAGACRAPSACRPPGCLPAWLPARPSCLPTTRCPRPQPYHEHSPRLPHRQLSAFNIPSPVLQGQYASDEDFGALAARMSEGEAGLAAADRLFYLSIPPNIFTAVAGAASRAASSQ